MKRPLSPLAFTIRPATNDDFDDLGRFFGAFAYGVFAPDSFAAQFAPPQFSALIACDDKGTLIAACLYRHLCDEAELIEIAVMPSYRRQSVATSLLDSLTDILRQSATTRLLLEVAQTNDAALAVYERYGFTPIGRRRRYYQHKIDAIMMELWLSKM
ncbi:MAG: GNAT family N-acetyltransferase [Candidatus Puniceispirillaceae bacterium]